MTSFGNGQTGIQFFSLYERKKYRSCRCCLIKANKIFTVIIIYKTNLSLLMPTSFRNLLKKILVFFIIIFFSLSKIDFCCHFSIIYGLPLAFFSSSRRSSSRLIIKCVLHLQHSGVLVLYRYQLPWLCDIHSHKWIRSQNKHSKNAFSQFCITKLEAHSFPNESSLSLMKSKMLFNGYITYVCCITNNTIYN